jgi:hypothetical protein
LPPDVVVIVGAPLLNGGVDTISGITFTEADLRSAAGERSFRRAQDYVHAVQALETAGDRVTAAVLGSDEYQVLLTLGHAGAIRGECDCPHGREGFFCKHCVAVGLTVLDLAATGPDQRAAGTLQPGQRARAARAARTGRAAGGLTEWLSFRDRADLLQLVREHLIEDDEWRSRLELRAASAAGDLTGICTRIADLLEAGDVSPYGYIEEGESWRYARRIREAAAIVDELVESGPASDAAAVAQYALITVAQACRNASDSFGAISDAADELVASHHAACLAAAPDPAELADFIAGRALSHGEVPHLAFGYYADALGPAGLSRLRERLTAAWQANPAGLSEQQALEHVLMLVGDLDALVEMLAAGSAQQQGNYLRIAEQLDRAGRAGEALIWAERGLQEAGRPNSQLADWVVQRYWSLGRAAAAVTVRRDEFTAVRSLAAFQQLRAAAERAGCWPATRQWAMDLLRADAVAGSAASRRPSSLPAAGPVLIDVLIAEGDLAGAWESARGIASDAQWLRLADLVAPARPAEALPVYLRLIEPLRTLAGGPVYERMANLLVSARDCHRRLGTEPAFTVYLRALRQDQKRKRKLISILDARQLTGE